MVVVSREWNLHFVVCAAEPLVPEEAAARTAEPRDLLNAEDGDIAVLLEYFDTYGAHREGILAYFEGRRTSGPVEGRNNRTRVVTKRSSGVQDTRALWTRRCQDANLCTLAVSFSVPGIHARAARIVRLSSGVALKTVELNFFSSSSRPLTHHCRLSLTIFPEESASGGGRPDWTADFQPTTCRHTEGWLVSSAV